jgi:hypothetical protein
LLLTGSTCRASARPSTFSSWQALDVRVAPNDAVADRPAVVLVVEPERVEAPLLEQALSPNVRSTSGESRPRGPTPQNAEGRYERPSRKTLAGEVRL